MNFFVDKARGLFLALPLTLALLVGLSAPAKALGEGPWLVTEVRGDAWLKAPDGGKTPLQQGAEIEPGSVVGAGDGGRATLSRGGTAMTLSPASETEIPADSDQGSRTTIFQRLGTLLLKVDKRPEQHFEVDTPFLAAVVKGTTFTVSVDSAGSAVHVVEGAVEVGSFDSGEVALVRPGQTARVSSRPGSGLKVSGIGAPAGQSGGNRQQGQNTAGGETDQAAAEQPTGEAVAPQAAKNPSGAKTERRDGQAKGLIIEQAIGWESIDIATVSDGFVAAVPARGASGVVGAATGGNNPGGTTPAGGKNAVALSASGGGLGQTVAGGVANAASGGAAASASSNSVLASAAGAASGVASAATAAASGAIASAAGAANSAVTATVNTVGTVVQNTAATVAAQNKGGPVSSVLNSLLGKGKKNGKAN